MKKVQVLMIGKFSDVMRKLRLLADAEYIAQQAEYRNEWLNNLKNI